MTKKAIFMVCLMFFLLSTNIAGKYNVFSTVDDPIMWERTYGGKRYRLNSMIQTNDNGFLMAGAAMSNDTGSMDALIMKIDANGEPQWNQTYGGPQSEMANSLITTADGGFLFAGITNSYGVGEFDAWLMKIDEFGTSQWNHTYGSEMWDGANEVVQLQNGGFAFIGDTTSSGPDGNVYLVKTDPEGNEMWNNTYGGSLGEDGNSLAETLDGGFILAGLTRSSDFGASNVNGDAFLVKTNSQGIVEWQKTYGYLGPDTAFSVILASDQGFIVAGRWGYDALIMKSDPDGTMQWSQTYGIDDCQNEAFSVIQTADGGYAATGGFGGSLPGTVQRDSDIFIMKISSNGVQDWLTSYGDLQEDSGQLIIQTNDGGFAVLGSTWSLEIGGWQTWFVRVPPTGTTSSTTTLPEIGSMYVITSFVIVMGFSLWVKRRYH